MFDQLLIFICVLGLFVVLFSGVILWQIRSFRQDIIYKNAKLKDTLQHSIDFLIKRQLDVDNDDKVIINELNNLLERELDTYIQFQLTRGNIKVEELSWFRSVCEHWLKTGLYYNDIMNKGKDDKFVGEDVISQVVRSIANNSKDFRDLETNPVDPVNPVQ